MFEMTLPPESNWRHAFPKISGRQKPWPDPPAPKRTGRFVYYHDGAGIKLDNDSRPVAAPAAPPGDRGAAQLAGGARRRSGVGIRVQQRIGTGKADLTGDRR